jgi:creatinine amidohydrolase
MPAMTVITWNLATRDELRAAADHLVLLPTGATEQHGPHLATGHDTFTVAHIAEQAAIAANVPIVLAPVQHLGSSNHHLPFGGTLSLGTDTYYRVMSDLVTSIITSGFRRIFILNGHGGNQELNSLVTRDITGRQPAGDPVAIAAAAYWEIARPSLEARPELSGIPLPGHAGHFETATMLATSPENTRTPIAIRQNDPSAFAVIPGTRVERTNSWITFQGFTDFPHRATPELGNLILEITIRDVASALAAFAATPLLSAPD